MEPTTTHVSDLAYAADLIKCAQVTTDYQDMARELAGPLARFVTRVFPGHLQLVYMLTDVNRRQVWNAYLCSPRIAPHMAALSDGDIHELRVRLLICRSHALIVDGYGSCDRGLIGLYGKLGPDALDAEFYVQFHATMTANEALRRSLAHAPAIDPRAIPVLHALPPELQSYPFARDLARQGAPLQFLELYDYIKQQNFPDKELLLHRLTRLIQTGRGYRWALTDICRALPFPPQTVPNEGNLRFIPNGIELVKVADRYRNCLRERISQALSGEHQYYEWHCPTPAVICLKRHRGSVWYISDMLLKSNEEPSRELKREIRDHLGRYGVGQAQCIADLFDSFLDEPVDVTEEAEILETMRNGG